MLIRARAIVAGGFVTLGLLLGNASAAQEESGRIQTVLGEARTLINQGRPAAAIERLEALDQPDHPQVVHLLGVAYYHADQHVRAIRLLTRIADKLPEGSIERREAIQVLGLSHYLAGHIPESIPLLEQTRLWASENIELSQILGMAYIQTRQSSKAREFLARTFGLPPDSAAAHLVSAQLMIRVQFYELADAELEQALAKDPRLPHARFLLAQNAIFRGRLDAGITLLRRELEVNPGNAMAYNLLGDAYTRQLQWEEAIAALQRSIWLNPYYSAPYILLGKAYTRKGQLDTAEAMLRRAIQYDPNNKSAHYLLAQLLQQTGRLEEARHEFEIAERLQEPKGR